MSNQSIFLQYPDIMFVLTCVPPSPGSVLYQSPWCGPASWDWPWSPWAVASAKKAIELARETIIVVVALEGDGLSMKSWEIRKRALYLVQKCMADASMIYVSTQGCGLC